MDFFLLIFRNPTKPFEELALEQYQCIVCCGYMHPPIRRCVQGHNYCNGCFKRMRNCPMCRSNHHPNVDFLLEALHSYLRFPCKYKERGCGSLVDGSEIRWHEKNCPVSYKRCLFYRTENCTWLGPNKNAVSHCEEIHSEFLARKISFKMLGV